MQAATTILRGALARIAGMTGEDARTGTSGWLTGVLAEINETAEAALDDAEWQEFEAERAGQPAPMVPVPDDLPL